MKYEDVKLNIKSGDIIATTHKEWNSWYDLQIQAVRIFTESEYSHVGVVVVHNGEPFILESVTPTIRLNPLSNLVSKGFYLVQTDVPMSEKELDFGMSLVGKGRYSKFEAVEGFLGTLEIGKDDLWMCAEMTITMRRLSGLDLGPKATPSAVVQKALEHGYKLQYVQG